MSRFFAALGFLSILPVPSKSAADSEALSRSVPCFVLVGLLFGGIAAAVDFALSPLLPPVTLSALLVVLLACLHGGLHIDGLADTADGFFSARTRERMLEIMRDSRSGPMGVAAIVCVLLMKFAGLCGTGGSTRRIAVLLMPVAGRCAIVLAMWWLPYARQSGGMATVFRPVSRMQGLSAIVVLGIGAWCLGGTMGITTAGLSIAAAAGVASMSRRKIGGYTGDTLGAASEVAEMTAAVALSATVF